MSRATTSSQAGQTIAVAADHAGFALKSALLAHLRDSGWQVIDLGTDSAGSVDYPDFGYALAVALGEGRATRGLAICGSGIGISIAANRFPGIRAALCHDIESAELARRHNDANVLALGARRLDRETAVAILETFLATGFEGGRHARRVDKLGHPPRIPAI